MQVRYHCGFFLPFSKNQLWKTLLIFSGMKEGWKKAGRQEGREGGKSFSPPSLTVVAPLCAMGTQEGISQTQSICFIGLCHNSIPGDLQQLLGSTVSISTSGTAG